MWGAIYNWIKSFDDIVKPNALRLHVDGNKDTQCFWGGFASLGIQVYMTYFIFSKM